MKKLFPLMFAVVLAGQVFAAETEVVPTEVVPDEVVATEAEVNEEVAVAELTVVVNELAKEGLSNVQIVEVVEAALENGTTENAYRSILKKSNQEKLVWFLLGATVATAAIYAGVPVGKKLWNYVEEKRQAAAVKNTADATSASAAGSAGAPGAASASAAAAPSPETK